MTILRFVILGTLLALTPAFAQRADTSARAERPTVTNGVVVSATSRTMVVSTDAGRHVLFVLDRETARPARIPAGARVRVSSRPDEEGIQVATRVTVTAEAAPAQAGVPETEPVPADIRRLEGQIERQVRRYGAGVRAGVALDPELFLIGVHARLGPFFHPDVYFRPNVDFGIGEVTTMFAVNLEGIYRLPITPRQGRWSAYLGAGPGFNFSHRNFKEAEAGKREIDFGDFDFSPGLNVLAGVQFRSGMFIELKSSAYSKPQLRMLVGYNF